VVRIRTTSIDWLLQAVWDEKGTDLLLKAGAPPLVRVDGELRPMEDQPVLEPEDTERLVRAALPDHLFTQLDTEGEIDFSFDWDNVARFRGNAYHQRGSLALALRLIPLNVPSFGELGIPEAVAGLADLPHGLVLMTGPTGSGKSTTQASMIDYINRHRRCHVLTIEDPIEYVHEQKRAAVSQREVGIDTQSFARALRAALREDPDVLLVGEMRDAESIQTVLTIAETGHLVFATLHTNDTGQALDRIIDVFPGDRQAQIRVQLAACLGGVVSQRLLPRIGGGQVAAFEVLIATGAVRNLLREGKTAQIRNVITMGQRDGMCTLEASLSDLVARGLVTHEEAVARSLFPNQVGDPTTPATEPINARTTLATRL
jgi:twitching motility protein PilT